MGKLNSILHLLKNILIVKSFCKLTLKNDEANPESRHHWQVCDALRCVAQEDGEENGGVPTRHLHLPLLWQRLAEERVCGYLALQGMPEDDCRRRLDSFHDRRRHRQKCYSPSPRNQRTSLNQLRPSISFTFANRHLSDDRWCSLRNSEFLEGLNRGDRFTSFVTLLSLLKSSVSSIIFS